MNAAEYETLLNAWLSETIDPEDYSLEDYRIRVEQQDNGLLKVGYFTEIIMDYSDDHSFPIFNYMAGLDIAPRIGSLSIASEDNGANGTQDWDVTFLLDALPAFTHLRALAFPMNEPDRHNGIIVTYKDCYEENGALGLILGVCPQLQSLTAPSAPGPHFFERKMHGLEELNLQSGYEVQCFIGNLARSTCFASLRSLSFQDYNQTYMENYKKFCVSFENYLLLLKSETLPSLKSIQLLSTVLSDSEKVDLQHLAALKTIDLQFA